MEFLTERCLRRKIEPEKIADGPNALTSLLLSAPRSDPNERANRFGARGQISRRIRNGAEGRWAREKEREIRDKSRGKIPNRVMETIYTTAEEGDTLVFNNVTLNE